MTDAITKAKALSEVGITCGCGLRSSRNPHPDAGDPVLFVDVGAEWVCIPCQQKALRGWSRRALKAEAELADLRAKLAEAEKNAQETWDVLADARIALGNRDREGAIQIIDRARSQP